LNLYSQNEHPSIWPWISDSDVHHDRSKKQAPLPNQILERFCLRQRLSFLVKHGHGLGQRNTSFFKFEYRFGLGHLFPTKTGMLEPQEYRGKVSPKTLRLSRTQTSESFGKQKTRTQNAQAFSIFNLKIDSSFLGFLRTPQKDAAAAQEWRNRTPVGARNRWCVVKLWKCLTSLKTKWVQWWAWEPRVQYKYSRLLVYLCICYGGYSMH